MASQYSSNNHYLREYIVNKPYKTASEIEEQYKHCDSKKLKIELASKQSERLDANKKYLEIISTIATIQNEIDHIEYLINERASIVELMDKAREVLMDEKLGDFEERVKHCDAIKERITQIINSLSSEELQSTYQAMKKEYRVILHNRADDNSRTLLLSILSDNEKEILLADVEYKKKD